MIISNFKKLFVVLSLLIVTTAFVEAQSVKLDWEMGVFAKEKDTNDFQSMQFKRAIKLDDESAFKFCIRPHSSCYCYVLLEDSTDNFYVLYKGSLLPNTITWIPDAGSEFELTPPPGTEKIYVLVFPSEDSRIAKICNSANYEGEVRDSASTKELIRSLKLEFANLGRLPEKPSTMGATVRAITKEDDSLILFSGASWYIKTVTINH